MILSSNIGSISTIPDWPTNDLNGLIKALQIWPLDQRMDFSKKEEFIDIPGNAPFRGRAWGHCSLVYSEALKKRIAVATKPIYPEFPDAVRFSGNFVGYSFGFWLDTADVDLIKKLDTLIAENIEKQGTREK